ncbi:MAG: hypothetical protein SGPRY_012057 [Prymnesium sp.]
MLYELQWREVQPSQHPNQGWEGNASSSRLRGVSVKKRNLPVGVRFEFRVRAFSSADLPTPFSRASVPVLVGDPAVHFDLIERERKAAEAEAAARGVAAEGRGVRSNGEGGGTQGSSSCHSTRSTPSSVMLEQVRLPI